MKEVMPTVEVLQEIAQRNGGKPPASVALNWCVSKGALPVVGIRTEEQARQAVEALGWRLTEEEVAEIDRHSLLGTTKFWQQV
jgi:aryl-alcohol dehydrogenase-like predicted oxidoreductase